MDKYTKLQASESRVWGDGAIETKERAPTVGKSSGDCTGVLTFRYTCDRNVAFAPLSTHVNQRHECLVGQARSSPSKRSDGAK